MTNENVKTADVKDAPKDATKDAKENKEVAKAIPLNKLLKSSRENFRNIRKDEKKKA